MSFINYLKEDLSMNVVMDGPKMANAPDNMKGDYEATFVEGEVTYSFLATNLASDEFGDRAYKIQMRDQKKGNTEDISEDPKVINGFVECITNWITTNRPNSFTWLNSTLYPAYGKIAEGISKKVKDYTFINETLEEETELADGVKREGNPVGRFVFTKTEQKESVNTPEDWYEKKQESEKDTFEKFEKPKDVTPPKNFMTYLKPELVSAPKAGY